jgi:zona occludens toxin
MAISLYTGLMGAGKSYSVVDKVIVPALDQGRHIVTNIPLKLDEIERHHPGASARVQTIEIEDKETPFTPEGFPPGAVVCIDEAWRLWPSGINSSKIAEKHREWFSMHRHETDEQGRSTQIVLISQHLADLASFLRNRIDKHYRATKLDAVGADKRYRIDIFKGSSSDERDKIRQVFGTYRPEVFALYQSHTHSDVEGSIEGEQTIDRRASLWKSPLMRYGMPLALVAIVAAVVQIGSIAKGLTEPEPTSHVPAAGAPARVVQASSVEIPPAIPELEPAEPVDPVEPEQKLSSTWRLGAVIEDDNRLWIFALGQGGMRRLSPIDCERRLNQWWCDVDGEMVTEFSGQRSLLGTAPTNLTM